METSLWVSSINILESGVVLVGGAASNLVKGVARPRHRGLSLGAAAEPHRYNTKRTHMKLSERHFEVGVSVLL